MNMQWSNITLICAVIISQLTIYGGADPNSDHTTDVGNNVPWIFDTEEAMVPLVSVTDEQREQELKYQNTLQYAKNLCVMAVTAKNIAMPTYIYHDISVMELYQLLDGSSLRRKYNLHQQLLDKLDHADTVTQEICKELRGHPPTRNVVFPTGESALVIEDLDAYEKSISDLTVDKISTLFDELLGGGEIVIETKLLKTLTPESLSDINAQFLIRRVGDFYSVDLGDSFKGARRENVLGAAKHDSEKLVAYEDWVNNKRNQIRYIAELINAKNVQDMVKQINDKQMLFLQALWFELFKTIESQIRLLVSVRLFRRAVIEITSNPTSEGKHAQVTAKGLELIYDGLEYNMLNDKQMISFHHKLEKLIAMLRNMYDVDISRLNLQDETNYIDLNTTTESKVDKVELECASSHLVNYYKSMDTDVDIMKKTTRKMKELGFKKGVIHKNVMQTLAKTNTMVGHLADILVDAHDNILDIERDVNGIHDGEVDTEVSPVKLLDRVYKLTAELSGVRMIMIEIYKSSCKIYRCDIEGNHIDVPDSFIEEIAKLTKKAQIALANTQVRYFEFRKAAGLMKDKAMALERSHRMESGKTALKLYQELVKPRRGIDIILRYFAYIDDYKNELNKMERIIQNAKHTSTENKRYQILQNYFDASKSIHDSLLLEKIIQTAMDMEIEFEKKVMTIEQHACQQKQYMKVKAKNIKNTRKNKQAKTKPLTDYEDARGHGNVEGAYVISPPHGAQIWDVAHDIIPQSHRVDELPKEPIVLKLEEHIPQAVQPQQPTIHGDKDDDSIHQDSASDYSATPPLSFASKTGILTTDQDTMPSVDKKTNMESGDLDQFHSFTSTHEPATDSDQHTSTSGETESSQTEKSNSEQWSQSADEVSDYSMLTDYEDARGHGNVEGAYVISPPHGAQIWDVAHDIIPQSHRVDELPKEPIVLKLEEHIPQAVQPQQPTIHGDKDDDSIHQDSASDYSATPPLSFASKTGILTTDQDTMPSVDKKTNMESGDLDQFHSFTSTHEPATDSDQHTSTSGETESSQTEKSNSEQWSQSADEVSDYSMLTDYEDARGHGNVEGAYVISPPHGAQIWDVAHDIIPQSHRVDELPKEPIVLKLEEHIPQAVQPQQPTIHGDKDDDSIHQDSASDYSATPPLSFASKTGILTTDQDTMPSVDKKTNMESGDLDQFHSFTSTHEPATDSDQHTSTSGETESSQTEKSNSEQWSQSADEVSDYSMLTDYEDARGHGNVEGAYVISPPHGAQIWDVAHDIIPQSHRVDELPKEPIVLKLEEHIPQAVQPQQPTIHGDKDDDSIHQDSASDYSATPPLSFASKTGILTTDQDTMPSVDKKTNMESGDLDQFHSFTSTHEPATDSDQHTSTSGETESSQTEKSNSEQWSQSADEVSDYSMLTDYEDARGHGNVEGAYVISPPHGAQIWDVAQDIIPQSHRVDELPKEPIVLKLEEHIPQAVQPQQPTIHGDKDDDSIHQDSASDYSATPPLSFASKTGILTTDQDTMPSVDKKTNMESGDLDQFHSFTSTHEPATDSDQHTSTSGETESSQTEKSNSEQWSQSADEVSDYSMLTDYEDARGHGNVEGAYVISPPHGAQIWDVAQDIIPQSHRVDELPKEPIVLKLEEHIPQAVQPTINGDKDDDSIHQNSASDYSATPPLSFTSKTGILTTEQDTTPSVDKKTNMESGDLDQFHSFTSTHEPATDSDQHTSTSGETESSQTEKSNSEQWSQSADEVSDYSMLTDYEDARGHGNLEGAYVISPPHGAQIWDVAQDIIPQSHRVDELPKEPIVLKLEEHIPQAVQPTINGDKDDGVCVPLCKPDDTDCADAVGSFYIGKLLDDAPDIYGFMANSGAYLYRGGMLLCRAAGATLGLVPNILSSMMPVASDGGASSRSQSPETPVLDSMDQQVDSSPVDKTNKPMDMADVDVAPQHLEKSVKDGRSTMEPKLRSNLGTNRSSADDRPSPKLLTRMVDEALSVPIVPSTSSSFATVTCTLVTLAYALVLAG